MLPWPTSSSSSGSSSCSSLYQAPRLPNLRDDGVDHEAAATAPTTAGFTYTHFRGTGGVHHVQHDTPLSLAFFSDQNLQILQNGIRRGMYDAVGKVVPEQNPLEIQTLMRAAYFGDERLHHYHGVADQIASLNQRIIARAVQSMCNHLRDHAHYMKDVDRVPVPLQRPTQMRDYSNRALELKAHVI